MFHLLALINQAIIWKVQVFSHLIKGRRISRFRQYSVGDMYSSAKSVFSNYVDEAKSGVS